jgi:hypothetical protein
MQNSPPLNFHRSPPVATKLHHPPQGEEGAAMAAFDESCRRGGHVLLAACETQAVCRSIRNNVGNSRPATARDPLLDHLVGDGHGPRGARAEADVYHKSIEAATDS